MYHVDSKYEKTYVVTKKELLFLIIIFTSILLFLYPKSLLKQQIASENSNYDLSMLYLKNLLLHSPNDESLMLLLAEQSLKNGERDKSLELLTVLQFSKNKKRRKKAILLAYELYKLNYNDSIDKKYRESIQKKLKKLFYLIFKDKLDKKNDYNLWYNEAIFNKHHQAIYYYLKKKLRYEPTNISLIKNAYFISSSLGNKDETIKYIKQLIQYDKKNYNKWVEAYYYLLINSKEFKRAELLLKGQIKRLPLWNKKLADFYFMRQKFKQASIKYIKLFHITKKYKEKRAYYFKAIQALQAGNLIQESVSLAKKYENNYIKDKKVKKFLLQLYIATGHLNDGANLSNKILKNEWQR